MKIPMNLLVAATLAAAATPPSAFILQDLAAGGSKACRDVGNLGVSVKPEAVTYSMHDFATSYPDDQPGSGWNDTTICVFYHHIADVPVGWRFRVDSVTYTGKAQFSGGAWVDRLLTAYYIDLTYATKPGAPVGEQVYATRISHFGLFDINNTTLGTATDGSFSVVVDNSPSPDVTPWSPCFAPDAYHDTKFQIGHQTHLYLGEQEGAKNPMGTVGKDWSEKLALTWEKCDPAVDTYEEWGSPSRQ
ncbi:hypothetical protein F4802DRAFT_498170 [Xylaria palmicola]|nr:hypothetical protein F4802DRAFT_498170 [Xylaria palmicola]